MVQWSANFGSLIRYLNPRVGVVVVLQVNRPDVFDARTHGVRSGNAGNGGPRGRQGTSGRVHLKIEKIRAGERMDEPRAQFVTDIKIHRVTHATRGPDRDCARAGQTLRGSNCDGGRRSDKTECSGTGRDIGADGTADGDRLNVAGGSGESFDSGLIPRDLGVAVRAGHRSLLHV